MGRMFHNNSGTTGGGYTYTGLSSGKRVWKAIRPGYTKPPKAPSGSKNPKK